jgi:hypothetical protein
LEGGRQGSGYLRDKPLSLFILLSFFIYLEVLQFLIVYLSGISQVELEMKVVVTGATGLVGNEVVKQCLVDVRITKVVILTRKAVSMDIESHPKADVIMVQDFSRYSDDLLRRIEGSSACLWYVSLNSIS